MLRKSVANYGLLLVMAIATTACSGIETRSSTPAREALPVMPSPQLNTLPRREVTPQVNNAQRNFGAYVPPAFEEYKPQSSGPYASLDNSYESYTPDTSSNDAFTTPLETSPPVVVERLSPRPVVQPKPVVVKPVEVKKPKVEGYSANELDIDPFADIPERETLAVKSNTSAAKPAPRVTSYSLSAAANALLIGAQAEAALGRYGSAINKVERALRIEPNSPVLWYQLGNLNYGNGRYDQAISLGRKSLGMSTGNRNLVSQNLDLMSKAATKTGDTKVFKEVLDYKRMNP